MGFYPLPASQYLGRKYAHGFVVLCFVLVMFQVESWTWFSQSFTVSLRPYYLYNGSFIHGKMILYLTHWGRVTHICVSKLTIICSDNGLSPSRHQAIIWTNAGILLICPLATNFSEILIEINTFSLKKMHLKMSSAKGRPFCLGLNVLNETTLDPTRE